MRTCEAQISPTTLTDRNTHCDLREAPGTTEDDIEEQTLVTTPSRVRRRLDIAYNITSTRRNKQLDRQWYIYNHMLNK
jgi:hypothetical protein